MASRRWSARAVLASAGTKAVTALAALSLLAGGCGSAASPPEPQSQASTSEEGFPITVHAGNESVTVQHKPRRIVSLSPTATEMLFAIGAGEQVVAVDDQSNYPPRAPQTKLSAYQPNLEAIARHRPDLVVVSDTSPPDVAKGLSKLGVTVLLQPSPKKLAGVYDQIRDLGAATGHPVRASDVAGRLRARLHKLFTSDSGGDGQDSQQGDQAQRSVYHELSPDLYTASSRTFIGQIYAKLGLTNIADKAATKSGDRYPQLSAEYVVSADPNLIVLADGECCGVTPKTVRARPGWGGISAVRSGAVVTVDKDVASRWGPRLPKFVAKVARAMKSATGPAAQRP